MAVRRIVATVGALTALLAALVGVATPASAAGTGTVSVNLSAVGDLADDIVRVAVIPDGGVPVDQYPTSPGLVVFPDVPSGSVRILVSLGGNLDVPKIVLDEQRTVTDGQTTSVGVTVDDSRVCVTYRITESAGGNVRNIGVRSGQPGIFGNNLAYLTSNGPTVETGGSPDCYYSGSFVVEVYDLDGGFTQVATVAVEAPAGTTLVVPIVLGPVEPPAVSVSGNPDARASNDLATGTTSVTLWRGSTDGLTFTATPDCGGVLPTSVVFQHNGISRVMTGPVGPRYSVAFTRAELDTGAFQVLVTCPGDTPVVQQLGRLTLYDPSGFVTDAVTSLPVPGAEVTLYEVPGWTPASAPGDTGPTVCESNLSKDPADPWGQAAPTTEGVQAGAAALEGRIAPAVVTQVTDEAGHYGWDVSYGCWYVTVSAPGYEDLTSPVVGVPPEVTDLDLELTPLAGVPGAPTGVTAVPGVTGARLSWTAPSSDGGSAITGYRITVLPGGATVDVAGTTAIVVSLTDGAAYRFAVSALNATGAGPQSAPSAEVALGFPDVVDAPVAHPFYDDIAWLANVGITGGYSDGTFRPSAPISRQAMAAFLYRYAGSPSGADPTCSVAPFPDVPSSHPFCGEITWMAGTGITGGYADGTFRPSGSISRQAMAAFLYRLAGSPNGADPGCTVAAFPDVPVTHGFCGEITWMAGTGVTGGYVDGTFRPTNPVSRQAMAAFLHRYDDL